MWKIKNWEKIGEFKIQYQNTNIPSESIQLKANNDLNTNYTSRIIGSKVQFENIPETSFIKKYRMRC